MFLGIIFFICGFDSFGVLVYFKLFILIKEIVGLLLSEYKYLCLSRYLWRYIFDILREN